MYDEQLAYYTLRDIEAAIELALSQSEKVSKPSDFTDSQDGLFLMGGICMQLINIGEKVKVLDQKTNGELLANYPEIPWNAIKGLRNIIVHEYNHVDEEEIFNVLKHDLPELLKTVHEMKYNV